MQVVLYYDTMTRIPNTNYNTILHWINSLM